MRLPALAAVFVAALILAGCGGHGTIRTITSSADPSQGSTPVTFTGTRGEDNTCSGLHLSHWTTSDNPDVTTNVEENPGHDFTFTHSFPALAPGASRQYLVTVTPDLTNLICGDMAGTEINQTINGPPVHPVPPVGGPPAAGPSASFTFSPTNPVVDQRITFDGSGSTDTGGTIVRYDWTFGADAFPDQTASGQTVQTNYQSSGTRTVSLTVTDDKGKTSTVTHDVTVMDGVQGGAAPKLRAAASAPAGAIYLSTSPQPRAQTVTHLFGEVQNGTGKVRDWSWDFNGDRHYDATTSTPSVAHVFTKAGSRTLRLRARLASGGSLTTSSAIVVGKAPAIPHRTVTQPFVAQIASATAAGPSVKRLLNSLATSKHRHPSALADSGSFRLQALGGFRPGAAQLLAPLLSATTRGTTHIDVPHRVVRATYLLHSAVTGSRTCLGVTVHYGASGSHGTLAILGGTGLSQRLRGTGSFAVAPDIGHTHAQLAGTLRLHRGSARKMPAKCRALRSGS
jgi:PKD repeat protein